MVLSAGIYLLGFFGAVAQSIGEAMPMDGPRPPPTPAMIAHREGVERTYLRFTRASQLGALVAALAAAGLLARASRLTARGRPQRAPRYGLPFREEDAPEEPCAEHA